MAAGWQALAVVLFVCAAPLLLLPAGGGGAPANDDDLQQQEYSLCSRNECTCVSAEDDPERITAKCTFSGNKNVDFKDVDDKVPSLVSIELYGDDHCNLTLHSKTFTAFSRLRSFSVTGFDKVTVMKLGLHINNTELKEDLNVTVARVRRLELDSAAVQPTTMVNVLIEDCDAVHLGNEVISKLQSFVFRRVGNLTLSENTFRNAAVSSAIKEMTLENLNTDKLPSKVFTTSIDLLSIENCTIGSIESNAFPITSMGNVTLTNVTVDRIERWAFKDSLFIDSLRMIRCRVREMGTGSIMSTIRSIHIEESKFVSVSTSAVTVGTDFTLCNNSFERVAKRGFLLHDTQSIQMDGNDFGQLGEEAFYESIAADHQWSAKLLVRDNAFSNRTDTARSPAVRLQLTANVIDVSGNRWLGPCSCGRWWFVAVANGTTEADGDEEFTDHNYCRADVVAAACANTTAAMADRNVRIREFVETAGCGRDAAAYERCVKERRTAAADAVGFRFLGNALSRDAERGVITAVVMLVLCGFAVVCAVKAVTWLNARGYFIKLRTLLTTNGGRRGCRDDREGSSGDDNSSGDTGMSACPLSPISVHDYAELHRYKNNTLDGGGRLGDVRDCGEAVGVRVFVYQDRGTQTVPEELTHEMLQTLRDNLDDPDNYAEARGMIEHLYDLIRVEEKCCGGNGSLGSGEGWRADGSLDDMTSTITTKAVTVGQRRQRDVRSVGTGVPSLERLWPPKLRVDDRRRGGSPPSPDRRPPSEADYMDQADYMDPVDFLYGGVPDDGSDMDIYCELTDLRDNVAETRHQEPPPLPKKPTQV